MLSCRIGEDDGESCLQRDWDCKWGALHSVESRNVPDRRVKAVVEEKLWIMMNATGRKQYIFLVLLLKLLYWFSSLSLSVRVSLFAGGESYSSVTLVEPKTEDVSDNGCNLKSPRYSTSDFYFTCLLLKTFTNRCWQSFECLSKLRFSHFNSSTNKNRMETFHFAVKLNTASGR